MSSIEMKTPPRGAQDFFQDGSLDPVEATRTAMSWVDRYKFLEGLPDADGEGLISKRESMDSVRNALSLYGEWSKKQGLKPFSNQKQAANRDRASKINEKLPDWSNLFSDDGFEESLKERGLDESYKRIVKLTGSEEVAKSEFRRKLFLSDLRGSSSAADQVLVSRALGFNSVEDSEFLKEAGEWVKGTKEKKEKTEAVFSEGVKGFIDGSARGGEFLKRSRELGKDDPNLRDAYQRGWKKAREDYKGVAPVAKAFIEGVLNGDQTSGGMGPQILSLYRGGKRKQFLESIAHLSPDEGEDVEGFWNKMSVSLQRGMADRVGEIIGFSERRSASNIEQVLNFAEVREDADELGTNELYDDQGNRTAITPEESERLAEIHSLERARTNISHDLSNLRGEIQRVKASLGGWMGDAEQGLYSFTESASYTAMAMVPGGALGTFAAMAEDNTRTLMDNGYSEDQAMSVGSAVAVPMAAIEMVQGRTVMNVMPGGKSLMSGVKKALMTRMGAKLAGAATVGAAIGAEYTQETIQEALLPITTEFIEGITDKVPELNQWEDFDVMNKERFWAVLPLTLLGGTGGAISEQVKNSEIKQSLSDSKMLAFDGQTQEEIERIQEDLKTSPRKALETYREIHKSKTPEEREKVGMEAMEREVTKASPEMGEIFKTMPTIRPAEDGGFTVDFKDGRVEQAETAEEAQSIFDEWTREEFLNTKEATKAMLSELVEKSEGDNDAKIAKPRTFQQLADTGVQSAESLTKAIQVYYAQMGQTAPDKIDLANYTEDGSVRLRNKLGDYSVRIAKGANPLTVAEEFSEGFVRRAVHLGETTFEDVKTLLDEFGEMSGLEMVQGYDIDPERAVIEGFSKFAKAYALQGDYASLPQETRGWFKKAWRILENPDSIPGPLRAMVELLSKMLKVVHDVAKAIEFHRMDGNGLNSELEGLAKRALGLDEKAYAERMEEQYRKEIMEELYDPSEELSAQVKGKLPRPKDPAANGYEGELSAIFDRFKKRSRNKKGGITESTIAATQLFAKTGEGIPLDQLRADLNERGFQFDDASEMLDAIEESQRGNKQWPVTMGDDLQGQTYSIGNTEVTPNAETLTFPTKDGGVVGPASFSIRAFHGTPHKVDKFTTDKMGTGEGAQAYGWGLYFAQKEAVAESYRDELAGIFVDGKKIDSDNYFVEGLDNMASLALVARNGDFEEAIEYAETRIGKDIADELRVFDRSRVTRGDGNLYRVEMKAEKEELLDLDKPMTGQSKLVKEILKSAGIWKDFRENKSDFSSPMNTRGELIGLNLIAFLEWKNGGPEKAAKILRDLGIKGSQFKDQGTRNQSRGTHNYVIFNDADIEITEENGKPVEMGATFSISPAQDAIKEAVVSAEIDLESTKSKRRELVIQWEKDETRESDENPTWFSERTFPESEEHLAEFIEDPAIYQNDEGFFIVGEDIDQHEDLEAAIKSANQKIQESYENEGGKSQFGADQDGQRASDQIFGAFPDLSIVKKPWVGSKWGSMYLELKDGSKLSVRDHQATRKDMGLPDYSYEVSRDWKPEEVGNALIGALNWIERNQWSELTEADKRRLTHRANAQEVVSLTDMASTGPVESRQSLGNEENGNPVDTGASFSLSPAQDAVYLSAVESGDMESAQEMVDEAAKAAGYDYGKLYHGKPGDFISQFDPEQIGQRYEEAKDTGFHFTSSPNAAVMYAGFDATNTGVFVSVDGDEITWYVDREPQGYELNPDNPINKHLDSGEWGSVQEVFLNIKNPLIVKANEIRVGGSDAVAKAKSEGNDAVIIKGANWDSANAGVPVNDQYIVFSPNQIKSADPVTYDESGNVIPLSQRFDETRDEISFSISETAQRENTLEAIDRLFTGPSGMIETGQKLRARLSAIRERYETTMFGKKFSDTDTREMETMNSLMQLNAIASVLPREIRHVVGSPVTLVALKTEKARERYVINRLDKISLALDKHLQKELRESIRKNLDKSGFKVSDSRRRKGKIGKIGHEVVEQIREVMPKTMEEAEAIKNSLTRTFDEIEAPQGEDFERWDSRTLAVDLFYDYENATTARLEQAHEFVTTNYKEGRKEWLTTLKARKEQRDQWVAEAIGFMGDSDRVYLEDLTKAENKAKGTANRIAEGAAEWIFSNHHTLARIVENAKDKTAAREWYNRLLDTRIQGDMKAEREADEKQQAFFDKVAELIGATGATKGHSVRRFLHEAKRTRKNDITTIEGESREKVSVDKHVVENLLNGEVSGIDGQTFTRADLDALQKQWEKFEDLTEAEQNRVRKIKFDRVIAQGERRPVGELSQAEALQWWLTMRQPDQREKLETMGWDSRTMEELESFLSDDVKAVGLWMSKDLVKDGAILSDTHAEEFGIGLNTGENYFPVRNRIVDQPVQMDMNDPGAGRNISPGSLKERVSNRARPAQANAFGTYFQHVTEMAYWKHNVGWVRQYGGAMKTKAFSEAMEAKVGKHAANSLQKYLSAVQNRGVNAGRQMLAFERLVKSILSRVSLSVLGARVSTMWVNATAFVNAFASPDVSATAVMKNMIKMAFDSKGELKASWRNELAVMRRRMGASFEAQIAMKSGNAGHWLIQDAEKLAQKGLIPMNNIDVATNTLTMAAIYRAHYDAAIKRGESAQEAREFADAGLTRAHATLAQPTLSVSRSQAEMATSQNPFMGILTMFMSEVRKNAANNYVAWRTLMTGKGTVDRGTAGRQAAVYTLVYTGVVQAFRGLYDALRGDDEDDKEIEEQLKDPNFWAYAIASDNLRPIPLLGDAVLSLMAGPLEQKYWDQKTPVTRIVNQWKQTERIFDDKSSDSEKLDEVFDQMQSWGSILPGGPIFAEAANLGDFAKQVFEDGMGYDISEADQIKRFTREILENKAEINERTEDKEERIELLADVIAQYRDENPEKWDKIREGLQATEGGKVKMGADNKPLFKVSREVMKRADKLK